MKRKLIIICTFALALMLLVCGCEGAEQEVQAPEKSTTEDIFDPFGHIAMGYFDMTPEEILQRNPEMSIALNDEFDPENNTLNISLGRRWTIGSGGREFLDSISFENQQVTTIVWGSLFYAGHEEEAKEFFYGLCERMREITDEPMWCGYRKFIGDELENYSEIPIEDVEESLSKDEAEYYSYRIDMENKYYDEYDISCGYQPFDPGTIKEDARWIQGLEDAKVIEISYMSYSTLVEAKKDNCIVGVSISIER